MQRFGRRFWRCPIHAQGVFLSNSCVYLDVVQRCVFHVVAAVARTFGTCVGDPRVAGQGVILVARVGIASEGVTKVTWAPPRVLRFGRQGAGTKSGTNQASIRRESGSPNGQTVGV